MKATCIQCHREVPSHRHKNARTCSDACSSERKRQRSARNRREHPELWRRRSVLNEARRRAERAGLPFNLTVEDLSYPPTCPVLGIPIIPGADSPRDNSPSLDRLVPERGYTRGNIRIISKRANTLKSNATPAELRAVAAWLEGEIRQAGGVET